MGKVVHGCLPRKKKGGPSGKASGKKNAGVGVDFKRVKHKVGKKLPKALNETDASFKSHTINLPSQTVQQDKDGIAVNFQNLSLQELLVQTGHYSEKARKQSLAGLSDLFARHPEQLTQHTHLFFTKVAERVGDGDAPVRQALRSLMREKVFPMLEPGVVRPFMPVIMAHMSSAMTNLNMQVRLDALNFMDILMDFVPQLVVGGFLAPCLLHFCDLLSQAHRGRSVKSQSIAALLKVVTALNSFLRRAHGGAAASDLSGSASTASQQQQGPAGKASVSSAAAGFPLLLMHDRAAWPAKQAAAAPLVLGAGAPAVMPGLAMRPATGTPALLKKRKMAEQQIGAKLAAANPPDPLVTAASVGDVHGLTLRLVKLLFECWAECGPSNVVGDTPDLEGLQVLSGILSAAVALLNRLLLQSQEDGASTHHPAAGADQGAGQDVLVWVSELVLKRLPPHFPATIPSVKPSHTVADALVQYNLQASQLLAMLLPVAGRHLHDGSGEQEPWVHSLLTFYTGVLERAELVPARGMLSEASSVAGLATNASYLAVLRGVGSAVRAGGVAGDVVCVQRLTAAVEMLAARMTARSPVRAACLSLQHSLMAACRRGEVYIEESHIACWLQQLPKLIWELGDSAPETTTLALIMLLDAARFTPTPRSDTGAPAAAASPSTPGVQPPAATLWQALKQLQRQLAPLFCSHMPPGRKQQQQQQQQLASTSTAGGCPACERERGEAASGVERARLGASGDLSALTPGPIARLPAEVQLLAVDLIYHMGPLDPGLLKALASAVLDDRIFSADNIALRLVEITLMRLPDMPREAAASWVHALLFSPPPPPLPGSSSAVDEVRTRACWPRQQAVVDRVCQALPGWASGQDMLRLLTPQMELLLAAGSTGLSDQQRYSVIRLAAMAGGSCEAAGDKSNAIEASGVGVDGPLPTGLRLLLPAASLDFFASQCRMAQQQAAAAPATFSTLAATAAGTARAAAVVLQLLQAQTQLLPDLVRHCVERAVGPASGSSRKQGCHSGACMRASFCSSAGLLQQVLRCRSLQVDMLAHKAEVAAAVQRLTGHAREHAELSGDPGCKAECSHLEQVARDLYGIL